MSAGWIDAFAVLSTTHAAEFEAVFEAALEPCGATAVPYSFLRVRLRDVSDEVLLLMALSRVGQAYWVAAKQYAFPADWEDEVRRIVAFHGLHASVVSSVCYRLELRNAAMLDDLRGAVSKRAPIFGPTYPRIAT